MIGTTPDHCQQCVTVRAGDDADAAARWLQGLADCRRAFHCPARRKTGRTASRECCGREAREVAVFGCSALGRDVEPRDCYGCVERPEPDGGEAADAAGEASEPC